MQVHFTADQELQLSQLAQHSGTDVEHLVKEATLRMLQEDSEFRAAVEAGLIAADRGEFVEASDVWKNIEAILQD